MAQLPILSQSEIGRLTPTGGRVPPAHLQVRETQRAGRGLFTHPRANSTVSIAPKPFGSHLQNRCQYFDKNMTEGAGGERAGRTLAGGGRCVEGQCHPPGRARTAPPAPLRGTAASRAPGAPLLPLHRPELPTPNPRSDAVPKNLQRNLLWNTKYFARNAMGKAPFHRTNLTLESKTRSPNSLVC